MEAPVATPATDLFPPIKVPDIPSRPYQLPPSALTHNSESDTPPLCQSHYLFEKISVVITRATQTALPSSQALPSPLPHSPPARHAFGRQHRSHIRPDPGRRCPRDVVSPFPARIASASHIRFSFSGVVVAQTLVYFRIYPKDSKSIKSMVTWLCSTCTSNSTDPPHMCRFPLCGEKPFHTLRLLPVSLTRTSKCTGSRAYSPHRDIAVELLPRVLWR